MYFKKAGSVLLSTLVLSSSACTKAMASGGHGFGFGRICVSSKISATIVQSPLNFATIIPCTEAAGAVIVKPKTGARKTRGCISGTSGMVQIGQVKVVNNSHGRRHGGHGGHGNSDDGDDHDHDGDDDDDDYRRHGHNRHGNDKHGHNHHGNGHGQHFHGNKVKVFLTTTSITLSNGVRSLDVKKLKLIPSRGNNGHHGQRSHEFNGQRTQTYNIGGLVRIPANQTGGTYTGSFKVSAVCKGHHY